MDAAKYWTQARELNWNYGLFRIWIVFSVIWCGSFSISGFFSPASIANEKFLLAFIVPIAVFVGGKGLSMLLSWIYGGFKAEETQKPDYLGSSQKAVSAIGRGLLRVFLYIFASVAIAGLISVVTIKIYQWLDISLEGNYVLTNPFVLLAVLLQFAAFKWIFFKDGKKGTAFLAYIVASLFIMIFLTSLVMFV